VAGVIEDVVRAFTLAAANELAPDDDAALGEADLLANLRHLVPARVTQGRRDEFRANVTLAETSLVHVLAPSPRCADSHYIGETLS
jgi:hypothetical protein